MIRILVDNEEDRAAVLAAMERGRLTDLLLHPFVVAWDHGNLLPDATGDDSAPGAVEANGFCAAPERRLLVMADAGDASPGPTIRRGEREELQREWIAASAECGRRAGEALTKAADVPAGAVPGRPDGELAGAWAGMGHALPRRGGPQHRSRWHHTWPGRREYQPQHVAVLRCRADYATAEAAYLVFWHRPALTVC